MKQVVIERRSRTPAATIAMSSAPHRKQVWMVKLDEVRPAVVVSREDAISGRPDVIIVPFSSTVFLRAPAGVPCRAGVAGLQKDSVALCPS